MDFVVRLSDLEARVVECVAPLIDKEGYELVRIKANNEAGKGHLAFFMDRKDRERAINMEDLEYLNRLLSDVLDVIDAEKPLFKKSYDLEVSSPGVESPVPDVEGRRDDGFHVLMAARKSDQAHRPEISLDW